MDNNRMHKYCIRYKEVILYVLYALHKSLCEMRQMKGHAI